MKFALLTLAGLLAVGNIAHAGAVTGSSYIIDGKHVSGYVGSVSLVGQTFGKNTVVRNQEEARVTMGNTSVIDFIKRLNVEDRPVALEMIARAKIFFR